MSIITDISKVPFKEHAEAAIKVDRLRDMVIDEVEALNNPEVEILAQIKEVENAVRAMFARKGKAH